MVPIVTRDDDLDENIRRLSGLTYQWPVFPPRIEREFSSHELGFRTRRRWLEGMVGIALYAAFALASSPIGQGIRTREVFVRLGLVVPLALLVNLAVRFSVQPTLHEGAIASICCLAGSVEVAFNHGYGSGRQVLAQLAIAGVLVFTNTVMRLRFQYAFLVFGWGLLAELYMLVQGPGTSPYTTHLSAVMVTAIAALTLVADYSQDREARLAFLRQTEKQHLLGVLSETNVHLSVVALTDPLTGLPNRGALEAHLTQTWTVSTTAGRTCSVIMVDVDRFKNLNDRYGHLYGDRVLKRVASLLAEALRGEDDFIARFGGEEFLVLLPDTSSEQALLVAERLRGLVELAGFPSVRAGDPSFQDLKATISCGVATTLPGHPFEPHDVIGAADEALYCAKREGRNRVRSHIWPEAAAPQDPTQGPEVWDEQLFAPG